MARFLCHGPRQDSTGNKYCPYDPGVVEFDCDECLAGWVRYQELLGDMEREAQKDTWG